MSAHVVALLAVVFILMFSAMAIAQLKLYSLRCQLEDLVAALRRAMETGVVTLNHSPNNQSILSLSLFVRELLQRLRDADKARREFNRSGYELGDGDEEIGDSIGDFTSGLAQAVTKVGSISTCCFLSGSNDKLVLNSYHSRTKLSEQKMNNLIIFSAENQLQLMIERDETFRIVPADLRHNLSESLANRELRSVCIAVARRGTSVQLVWLGLAQGIATINSAEIDRLHELTANTLRTLQLLTGVTRLLTDERDHLVGMSHDLRTPGVTAMYVLSDLITNSESMVSEEALNRIKIAERCLNEQLSGISEFIRIGRAAGEIIAAEPKQFDLYSLVAELISLYQGHNRLQSGHFKLLCPVGQMIYSDELLLRRILTNIISNAAKYSAAGDITVSVVEQDGDLSIKVVNPVRDLASEGRLLSVGVGLKVVKKLVRSINGEFLFRRLDNSQVEASLILRAVAANSVSPGNNKFTFRRALVLDDDEATARMHTRYVQNVVDDIDLCSSVNHAIELVRSRRYDLVISDFTFGAGESITEFFDALSRYNAGARVVVISGAIFREALSINRCSVTHLTKPVTREQMLAGILNGSPAYDREPMISPL